MPDLDGDWHARVRPTLLAGPKRGGSGQNAFRVSSMAHLFLSVDRFCATCLSGGAGPPTGRFEDTQKSRLPDGHRLAPVLSRGARHAGPLSHLASRFPSTDQLHLSLVACAVARSSRPD